MTPQRLALFLADQPAVTYRCQVCGHTVEIPWHLHVAHYRACYPGCVQCARGWGYAAAMLPEEIGDDTGEESTT